MNRPCGFFNYAKDEITPKVGRDVIPASAATDVVMLGLHPSLLSWLGGFPIYEAVFATRQQRNRFARWSPNRLDNYLLQRSDETKSAANPSLD